MMILNIKLQKEGGYRVTYSNNITSTVTEGGHGWKEVAKWLETNSPDPAETEQNIQDRKKSEVEVLAGQKADALLPQTSDRRKLKQVSRTVKLVLKKVKGTTSQNEEAELDALEALDNQIDGVYDAADSIKDQIDLNSDYDYINSPLWP